MAAQVLKLKRKVRLLPVLLFFCCSQNQHSPPATKTPPVELPKFSWPIVTAPAFKKKYQFDFRINPFYLQADFDQDGFLDLAILIKEQISGKAGLLLVRQHQPEPTIFGAGQAAGFGTDDWAWLQAWKIESVLPAGAGVTGVGATLILFPADKNKPAPWLFWRNGKWQWKED
jgi:hypothetical protein